MIGFEVEDECPAPAVVAAGGVMDQEDGGPDAADGFVAGHCDVRVPGRGEVVRLVPCPLPPGGVRVRVRGDGVTMTFLDQEPRVPPPTDRVEVEPAPPAHHPDPWMRRYAAGDFPGVGEDAGPYCEFVTRVPGGLCVSMDDEAPSRGFGHALAYFPTDRHGTVCREQAIQIWGMLGNFALVDAAEEAGHLLRRLAARPDLPADAADQLRASAADLHRAYQLQRLPEVREPTPA